LANATDFPIPADLEGFWIWDRLHCPRPLTPLEHELLVQSTGTGFTKAIGEMGSGIIAVCELYNYYAYLCGVARPLAPGETQEQRNAAYEKSVAELKPVVGDKWNNEWLPAMKAKLARGRNTDYSGYPDKGLMARFDEMRNEVLDRWYIHGLLLYSFAAANDFSDFYKEHISEGSSMEGYEALQGFETEATKSSRGLWNLSRTVRGNSELKTLFENSTPQEIAKALPNSAAGKALLADLNAYLEDYGWRADSVYELTQPAWRDDPSIPIGAIQGFIASDDAHGPESQLASAIKRREELLADARKKLAGSPDLLKQFEALYDAAKSFTPIVEDHNHWIDQMGDITMRYPCLEIGRRLVARGLLEAQDDVFMLYSSELHLAMSGTDYRDLVKQRKSDKDAFAKVVPPPAMGVPAPPTGDPVEDVLVRFFGAPVEPSADPSVLQGIAASPGTVTGTAKVVKTLDEASKLAKGDIMVCEMTLPPWTPLFSTVSAVVADTGGILSHCAIVAREYRIPCVCGTGVGTVTIKDGQTVTVDGSKGIVRIEA
jgi:phosphohistidine swiveling domain-containing protein